MFNSRWHPSQSAIIDRYPPPHGRPFPDDNINRDDDPMLKPVAVDRRKKANRKEARKLDCDVFFALFNHAPFRSLHRKTSRLVVRKMQ